MNPIYAHALMGGVLGVLFAVAITAPPRPTQATDQTPQASQSKPVVTNEANVVHADYAPPAVRDMGAASAGLSGLKGHLTTSWSEKLVYNLVVSPSDPARHEAFAAVVADPQRPLSVDVELKSALGEVLCDNQVVLKFDPRKSLKNSAEADSAAVRELARETSNDVFRNDIGRDGKIESISSEGTMPCSKHQYDTASAWALAPTFPTMAEQANRLQKPTLVLASAKTPAVIAVPAVVKTTVAHKLVAAPAIESARQAVQKPVRQAVHVNRAWTEALVVPPAAPATVAQAPAQVSLAAVAEIAPVPMPRATMPEVAAVPVPAFTFMMEGDDQIVDIDTAQKSIETSAGKVFVVDAELASTDADNWLNDQVNVHYRCDQSSSCTLSLADATVMHATLRSRHAAAQTEFSMVSLQTTPQTSTTPPSPSTIADSLDQ